MNETTPHTGDDSTQLRILGDCEKESSDQIDVDLEEQREHIREQAEAEEYWAGRNLADRNSTRRAA